jgi:siroheme decarboxylase
MDTIDRTIINEFQGDFPISPRPYADAAARLGIEEQDLINRLQTLLDAGTLSRFGPMFHAEKLGGGLTLAALAVPEDDFDTIAETVNGFPEVAHNYARQHHLNMWFVLATETPERIDTVITEIEQATGLCVHNMPKETEFFVGLRFEA